MYIISLQTLKPFPMQTNWDTCHTLQDGDKKEGATLRERVESKYA